MKKIALSFAFLLCLISFSQSIAFAQNNRDEKWMRVRSDNGEFSIEVPVKHNYFYDKDGFSVSKGSSDYQLKKMSMLNAFLDDTLLSFESYEAKKGGLESIYEVDKSFPKEVKASEFRRSGALIKQLITKSDDSYCVRQYFNSKNNIYVLTVATRNGENEITKRFLDSLVFNPDIKEAPNANIVAYTSLKNAPVNLIDLTNQKENQNTPADKTISPANKEKSKLTILRKPRCSYTDAARMKAVRGIIRLRLKFAEDGFIPEIAIIKSLPEGLLRQAVFAALRIKFIPDEKDAKVVSATRLVEYSFAIY